jgi:sulfite exporter TauE/SafE
MFIEIFIAALSMGLLGSLHCVGMCGPIIVSIPWSNSQKALQISLYHVGRATTYAIMGALVGGAGQLFLPKDLGVWPALISGSVLILVFFVQSYPSLFQNTLFPASSVASYFRKFLKMESVFSRFFMGMVNGILPCGMVYSALAVAILYHNALYSGLFMFLFGIGTSPLLVLLSRIKMALSKYPFFKREKTIRFALLILGLLIVLRGAGLGIPMLSPKRNCCAINLSDQSDFVRSIAMQSVTT